MVMVHKYASFSRGDIGGNAAAVCVYDNGLNPDQMQYIAKKVGFSETAFVSKRGNHFAIRYFTPTTEVDACGHATIATFSHLQKQGLPQGSYRVKANSTVLGVSVEEGGFVWINQPGHSWSGSSVDPYMVKDHLPGLKSMYNSFEPPVVDAGAPTVLVPVSSLDDLLTFTPNPVLISELLHSVHPDSLLYLFSLSTVEEGSVAHGRMFDPNHGINEESATGIANAALLSFLYSIQVIDGKETYRFEQGYVLEEPSLLFGKLDLFDGNEISRMQIGGKTRSIGTTEVALLD